MAMMSNTKTEMAHKPKMLLTFMLAQDRRAIPMCSQYVWEMIRCPQNGNLRMSKTKEIAKARDLRRMIDAIADTTLFVSTNV